MAQTLYVAGQREIVQTWPNGKRAMAYLLDATVTSVWESRQSAAIAWWQDWYVLTQLVFVLRHDAQI